MKIATNVPALKSLTASTRSNNALNTSVLRLSTGQKINSAKDDPAGLAISRRLKIQLKGLESASSNASDGISLVQTAEGALQEITNMIQRMRELAVQAANDTMETEDREKIQQEVDSLLAEINDIVDRTEFNKTRLLTGQAGRQSANFRWDTSASTLMATAAYISDQVNPGTLAYTVTNFGLPAKAESTSYSVDYSDNTNPVGISGELYINNVTIEIEADDTPVDIYSKILDVSNVGNFNVTLFQAPWIGPPAPVPPVQLVLCHNEFGSDFTMDISDNTGGTLVEELFTKNTNPQLTEIHNNGLDASITINSFTNANGSVDTSFASNSSVKASGNSIVITATNGWQINIDLHILMDDNAAFWTYDNDPIQTGGIIGGGAFQ